MGSQGQIISANKNNNGASTLTGLMDMYKKMSGGSSDSSTTNTSPVPEGYNAASPSQSTMPSLQAPEIGDSAMSRRAQANANQPDALIAQGLKHADNPDVPLDYDTRMAVAEPLLRAQHFGYGGGYEKGSQGQITSGKAPDTGGLGKIASIAALIA